MEKYPASSALALAKGGNYSEARDAPHKNYGGFLPRAAQTKLGAVTQMPTIAENNN